MSKFNFTNFDAAVNFIEAYDEKVELKSNPVVDVSEKVEVIPMSIENYLHFYKNCVIPQEIQRDHEYRLQNTKKTDHIVNPSSLLSQVDVVVCYHNNQFQLTDGNHRSFHWYKAYNDKANTFGQTITLPSVVYVHLKYLANATEEEYNALYYSYDNIKCAKKPEDYIQGAFREAKLEFESVVFKDAILSKVFAELNPILYNSPGRNGEKITECVRKIIAEYKTGMLIADELFVDILNLKVNGDKKPAGLITLIQAAIIHICNNTANDNEYKLAREFSEALLRVVATRRYSAQSYHLPFFGKDYKFNEIKQVLEVLGEGVQGRGNESVRMIVNAFAFFKACVKQEEVAVA